MENAAPDQELLTRWATLPADQRALVLQLVRALSLPAAHPASTPLGTAALPATPRLSANQAAQVLESWNAEDAQGDPQAQEPLGDAWDVLKRLAGTVEAPADWSLEHDHYLYGTPKRGSDDAK